MSFQETYQFASTHDPEVVVEGELAGRTVYLMHIHKDEADKVMQTLKDSFGAHVFDVYPPEDWHTLTEEQLSFLTEEQIAEYEKAKDKTLFRFYIPPSSDEALYSTTEVYENLIGAMNSVLASDPELITRMMFINFECSEQVVQNHPTLRGNVIEANNGNPVPAVSLWSVLNAVLDYAFGERVTFATKEDISTLNDLATGEDVIKVFLRTTK